MSDELDERKILSLIFDDVEPATPEDYRACFESPHGQAVLVDLARRFGIGRPSFRWDKEGGFSLEEAARADACKVIISDILKMAKFERPPEAMRQRPKPRQSGLGRLPDFDLSSL